MNENDTTLVSFLAQQAAGKITTDESWGNEEERWAVVVEVIEKYAAAQCGGGAGIDWDIVAEQVMGVIGQLATSLSFNGPN